MGSVRQRRRPTSTGQGALEYEARWRDTTGAQRSQSFRRKIDAERFLRQIEGDLARGVYIDPAGARTMFGAYAEEWRANQVHRQRTALLVESHLRNHIVPAFGKRRLGDIKPSDVQGWVRELSTTLAPATVRTVYAFARAIFRAAVEDRLIAHSPCKAKLPAIASTQVIPITAAQLARLTAATAEQYRAMVVTGAGSGLRPGELRGLTVDRVDFLRRTIRVDRQLTEPGSPGLFAPLKTAESARTVPISALVTDALAEHLARYGHSPDGLVFTSRTGQPLRRNRMGDVFARARTAAELHDITAHDLRHFYASMLIAGGQSVKVVQKRLGHSSAVETLDTYGHLWPDSEDDTRAAVDAVLTRQLVGRLWDESSSG